MSGDPWKFFFFEISTPASFFIYDVLIFFSYGDMNLWQVIEIMGDRVGVPMKVVIKRASDKLVTLTVIPEESNIDL